MFARGDSTLYPELPAQDEASYVIVPRPVVEKEKVYDKVPKPVVEDDKVYDKVPRQERDKFFSTNSRRKQVSIFTTTAKKLGCFTHHFLCKTTLAFWYCLTKLTADRKKG